MSKNLAIISNPEILGGKPVIAGTRISVEWVLLQLGTGQSVEEILAEYPHLKVEQINAALSYASDLASRPPSVAAE